MAAPTFKTGGLNKIAELIVVWVVRASPVGMKPLVSVISHQ